MIQHFDHCKDYVLRVAGLETSYSLITKLALYTSRVYENKHHAFTSALTISVCVCVASPSPSLSCFLFSSLLLLSTLPLGSKSITRYIDPTRYLDEKGQVKMLMESREEGHMSFGFGRRVCPGRHVAEGTLAIDFATLRWAMRFERPEGSRGELDVRTLVKSGLTVYVFLHALSMSPY